jgi:hypothetical protein
VTVTVLCGSHQERLPGEVHAGAAGGLLCRCGGWLEGFSEDIATGKRQEYSSPLWHYSQGGVLPARSTITWNSSSPGAGSWAVVHGGGGSSAVSGGTAWAEVSSPGGGGGEWSAERPYWAVDAYGNRYAS